MLWSSIEFQQILLRGVESSQNLGGQHLEIDRTNHVFWVEISKIFEKLSGQLPTLPLRLLWPCCLFAFDKD